MTDNHHSDARVWRSQVSVNADPAHVLDALTEVDGCHAWSPVRFDLDPPDLDRLRAGTRVGVAGGLAGRRLHFCVEVVRAGSDGLELRAAGPLEFLADYEVRSVADGSTVEATVAISRTRGRLGGLVARLTAALLSGGALAHTLARIAHEAERRQRLERAY